MRGEMLDVKTMNTLVRGLTQRLDEAKKNNAATAAATDTNDGASYRVQARKVMSPRKRERMRSSRSGGALGNKVLPSFAGERKPRRNMKIGEGVLRDPDMF